MQLTFGSPHELEYFAPIKEVIVTLAPWEDIYAAHRETGNA
jgi:hypothetical protein